MLSILRSAAILLALLTVLCGVLYPVAITALAQGLFPHQASGSLIRDGEKVIGSEVIGQPFTDPKYFWSRPSATGTHPYNGGASSASNLGPSNPALGGVVASRSAALRAADPGNTAPIPVDLVTTSGSGLDPHISPAAALYQVGRVARARGLAADQVGILVDRHLEGRFLGLLGEPAVNVLKLNLALDKLDPSSTRR